MEKDKIIIEKEQEGVRLDKIINEKFPELSRTAIQRLIEEEKIMLNGTSAKASYRVKNGDEIAIYKEETKEPTIEAQDIPLDVLYEDDDIIVINKPKGMVVHPGNGNQDGTLVNAVLARCKGSLSGIGGQIRPGIVHRLDKDTSGVIIVAKNDKAHIEISRQIQNREVKKTYYALVRGKVPENEATIKMPIGRSKLDRKKMAVCKDGKEAITHFKVMKRWDEYTLLEVKIETGRTHQIRVHMAQIGYPVVGDMVYSNGKNPFGVEGQMLHAKKIEFLHPITKKEMCIDAPLPGYFEEIVNKLNIEKIE